MWKYLIRVCNCLHYQVRHFYDISRQEITLPRFYGVHVANNDVLHPPRPNMKGKQFRSMYIYTSPGFFYWKCRILEISFYIIFFTFFLYLSFLCVSIRLVWEFVFILYFFTFFLYLSIFMCKYLFSSSWEACIYIPRLVSFTENAVYWKFLFILYFLLSFYIYHFYV